MYKAHLTQSSNLSFEVLAFGYMMLNDILVYICEAEKGRTESIPEEVLSLNEEFCYSSAKTVILQHRYASMRLF
jgi:hypothetical protein